MEGGNASSSLVNRLQKLEEIQTLLDGYDYVRFTFTDLVGKPGTKLVPARNAYDFLESGISFYSGFVSVGPAYEVITPKEVSDYGHGNILMMADLDTFHPVPWLRKGGYKTAEVLIEPGDYSDISKCVQSACPRFAARKQLKVLEDLGFTFKTGIEWEYYLLNRETEEPVFNKCAVHNPSMLTEFEDWFVDVDKNLYQAGVNIQTLQTEYGNSQFEFNSAPEYGIKSADGNCIMKQGMREMALQRGWQANFMSKISEAQPPCGAHFSFSLWDKNTGANAFYDEKSPNKLSPVAEHWIAGIIKHAPALTALCCPTVNCYQRLHQPWAPDRQNWGMQDRLAMLRVKNDGIQGTYMENRLPSSMANPYLVLAAVVAAGVDGVLNKMPCPEPAHKGEAPLLSHSLEESLEDLVKDDVLVNALGKTLVDWFILVKKEGELKALERVIDASEKWKIFVNYYGETG